MGNCHCLGSDVHDPKPSNIDTSIFATERRSQTRGEILVVTITEGILTVPEKKSSSLLSIIAQLGEQKVSTPVRETPGKGRCHCVWDYSFEFNLNTEYVEPLSLYLGLLDTETAPNLLTDACWELIFTPSTMTYAFPITGSLQSSIGAIGIRLERRPSGTGSGADGYAKCPLLESVERCKLQTNKLKAASKARKINASGWPKLPRTSSI
eukprot:NODE_4700_length_1128_cov_15.625871_g4167_i0.p1 GENE.NODE_4700_length_1128_cov_15.625871_g4167_i0~~NODE_4700_length_1128_cov_15.625871_g4167_i0.p1  ORF type:complete len:209 (-),score=29.83 NODE_4700_length_1128_cov_15.625871_g4167_i0:449-1075(-)